MTQTLRARLSRPMQWSSILIDVAVIFHAGILFAQGTEKNPSTLIDVVVSRGSLTVDVRNAPLAQVLRTIAERAGLDVTLRGDVSTPITESFAGLTLGEGITRLARGHSLALTYAAPAGQPKGEEILTGVWVMGGSSRPGSLAAATSAEPTLKGLGPGARNPGESGRSSLKDAKPDGSVTGAAVESPGAARTREILALTDEAVLGSEAATARLGGIVTADPDAEVRKQAVAALGQLKGAEVEVVLTEALVDVDASVRERAVRGLRGSGSETAVQSLTEVLAGDPDPQVRFAAVRALTSFPGAATLRTLESALSDPDARVRETAARGLSWWKAYLAEVH